MHVLFLVTVCKQKHQDRADKKTQISSLQICPTTTKTKRDMTLLNYQIKVVTSKNTLFSIWREGGSVALNI